VTGVTGQRKRFLPLTESTPEDLWESMRDTVDALRPAAASHQVGPDVCDINIITSVVARKVSNAATQTRKSVSVKPPQRCQKHTAVSSRKETAEKHEETDDDYSNLLVRLVQLLYLQTKLNVVSPKTESNSSANSNNQR